MKLTYTVTIGEAVEQHVFEGDAGDVITAYNALFDCDEFGSDDEPEPCSLTGRSCGTCKHQGECYGCGVHLANYEPKPSEPERDCNTCAHERLCVDTYPCADCTKSTRATATQNKWEPKPVEQEKSLLKAGDFVRVKEGIDKDKYENELGWSPYMDDMVGKVYPVDDVRHQDNRVYLKAPWRGRPYAFYLDDVELVTRGEDNRPKRPGEVLRVMMEAKGWDVNDLEAKTGIVAGYWQDIVDGKVHINKHDARRLSKAFGVPLDYWEPSWVFADGGYVEPANQPQDAEGADSPGWREMTSPMDLPEKMCIQEGGSWETYTRPATEESQVVSRLDEILRFLERQVKGRAF